MMFSKILTTQGENRIDRCQVSNYLSQRFTITPHTILENIHKEYSEQYEEVNVSIFENIMVSMIPKEPFGLLLSGGVDSSLLYQLYKPYISINIKTLITDETIYAKKVCPDVIIEELTPEKYYQYANEIYEQINEPVGDAAIISVYAGAKRLKELGINTMVIGEGGDEVFGGYLKYPQFTEKLSPTQFIELAKKQVSLRFNTVSKEFTDFFSQDCGNRLKQMMDWDYNIGLKNLFLWKNVYGCELAGIKVVLPFVHPAIKEYSERNLKQTDLVDGINAKVWLKNKAIELGVPTECVRRMKSGFASEGNPAVINMMKQDMGIDRYTYHIDVFPLWTLWKFLKRYNMENELLEVYR